MQNTSGGVELFIMLAYLGVIVLIIVGLWKVFEKANQPGWGAIIPIYNLILMIKISGKPLWWLILMFVPIISIIPGVLVPVGMAKSFGKSGLFGVGLIFLPFIFYPVLGFGDAEYNPAYAS